MDILEKLKVEFIGTCFVTYFSGICCLQGAVHGISKEAMCIGIMIIFILSTYFGRNISGAQYNPIISISLAVSKRQTYATAGYYAGVQIFSAVFSCSLLVASVPNVLLSAVASNSMIGIPLEGSGSLGLKFFLELIGSFFIVLGYYFLIVDETSNKNLNAPGYGALYFAVSLMLFKYTGAMLSVGRLFGYIIVSARLKNSWLYLLTNIIGGLIGGFAGNALILNKDKTSDENERNSAVSEVEE